MANKRPLGLEIIPGGWRHRLIVWIVAWAGLVTDLITILTLGHVGTNWELEIHFHGLTWRDRAERSDSATVGGRDGELG